VSEIGAVMGQGDPPNPARTASLGGSKGDTKFIIGLYLAFKSNFMRASKPQAESVLQMTSFSVNSAIKGVIHIVVYAAPSHEVHYGHQWLPDTQVLSYAITLYRIATVLIKKSDFCDF
jgi:hypothetical protein